MPSLLFAVLHIPSCNVLNGYFYVSLSLVAVQCYLNVFENFANFAIS